MLKKTVKINGYTIVISFYHDGPHLPRIILDIESSEQKTKLWLMLCTRRQVARFITIFGKEAGGAAERLYTAKCLEAAMTHNEKPYPLKDGMEAPVLIELLNGLEGTELWDEIHKTGYASLLPYDSGRPQ